MIHDKSDIYSQKPFYFIGIAFDAARLEVWDTTESHTAAVKKKSSKNLDEIKIKNMVRSGGWKKICSFPLRAHTRNAPPAHAMPITSTARRFTKEKTHEKLQENSPDVSSDETATASTIETRERKISQFEREKERAAARAKDREAALANQIKYLQIPSPLPNTAISSNTSTVIPLPPREPGKGGGREAEEEKDKEREKRKEREAEAETETEKISHPQSKSLSLGVETLVRNWDAMSRGQKVIVRSIDHTLASVDILHIRSGWAGTIPLSCLVESPKNTLPPVLTREGHSKTFTTTVSDTNDGKEKSKKRRNSLKNLTMPDITPPSVPFADKNKNKDAENHVITRKSTTAEEEAMKFVQQQRQRRRRNSMAALKSTEMVSSSSANTSQRRNSLKALKSPRMAPPHIPPHATKKRLKAVVPARKSSAGHRVGDKLPPSPPDSLGPTQHQ